MRFRLILTGFLLCNALIAQQTGNTPANMPIDNLVPPSPNASALGKYGQVHKEVYTYTTHEDTKVFIKTTAVYKTEGVCLILNDHLYNRLLNNHAMEY